MRYPMNMWQANDFSVYRK